MPSLRARSLFAPIDAGGRAETVARRLIQAIRLGLLLDGERLPAESTLAGQFGVSPVTLREALADPAQHGPGGNPARARRRLVRARPAGAAARATRAPAAAAVPA